MLLRKKNRIVGLGVGGWSTATAVSNANQPATLFPFLPAPRLLASLDERARFSNTRDEAPAPLMIVDDSAAASSFDSLSILWRQSLALLAGHLPPLYGWLVACLVDGSIAAAADDERDREENEMTEGRVSRQERRLLAILLCSRLCCLLKKCFDDALQPDLALSRHAERCGEESDSADDAVADPTHPGAGVDRPAQMAEGDVRVLNGLRNDVIQPLLDD
uniref:Uncharacterized protein n=1 Tax=Plectus sambesii TaxID=2011161 RepID=A0A914WMH9_9BILA